jgi:hypothetical protein
MSPKCAGLSDIERQIVLTRRFGDNALNSSLNRRHSQQMFASPLGAKVVVCGIGRPRAATTLVVEQQPAGPSVAHRQLITANDFHEGGSLMQARLAETSERAASQAACQETLQTLGTTASVAE